MKVYNTLTRKREVFKPRKGKNVKMFVCGVTSYDYSHIGHGRSYVVFDVIAKYLRWKGYKVYYLQNVTDIDDRTIKRGNESGEDPLKLAKRFTKIYFEDMKSLGVDSVTKYAPATNYVKPIIKQIKSLMDKGYAYETEDGVYFEISKFKNYGKLSHQPLDKIRKGARVAVNEKKRNPADFVLWKKYKPGEPYWSSLWGKGRPGWHIEDTAITETEFGTQYDLHGGGLDLIFPHHDAEIAQMEGSSGKKPMVKYWLHNGFIEIKATKMSKSLGNFITLRDALKKWSKENLRMFLLSTHYRNPLDFYDSAVDDSKNSLDRISEAHQNARDKLKNAKAGKLDKSKTDALVKKFEKHMDEDFNTPRAIAVLFDFSKFLNTQAEKMSKSSLKYALTRYIELADLLGILQKTKTAKIPKEIKDLMGKREKARKAKDFALADKLRDELKKKGYSIQDSDKGPLVRLING